MKILIPNLTYSHSDAIFCVIGRGNPVSKAAVATVTGGILLKNQKQAYCIVLSLSGALLCGVTLDTFSTPAGSFLCRPWKVGKRAIKTLSKGGIYGQKVSAHARTGTPPVYRPQKSNCLESHPIRRIGDQHICRSQSRHGHRSQQSEHHSEYPLSHQGGLR